jgi:hypothetical protein
MSTRPSGLGYSPDNPIKVGGGRVFAAFNEQQYLRRLRGPSGEPLEFERLGSTSTDPILDIYLVRSAAHPEPVRLLLDAYDPGPNGVPEGFTLDHPDEPWELATSIVPADPSAPPPTPSADSRKWLIAGSGGETFGFVECDNVGQVSIDMTEHAGALLRERVDSFMAITPPEYRQAVLADVLERIVPWESRGMVRGVPAPLREEPEWSKPAWGAKADDSKRGRRWPFRRGQEAD